MRPYTQTVGGRTYQFADLRDLLAKATPERSGDHLAGLAAASAEERVAAQIRLADLPLTTFLEQPLIPYEDDSGSTWPCCARPRPPRSAWAAAPSATT